MDVKLMRTQMERLNTLKNDQGFTEAQVEALRKLYDKDTQGHETFDSFMATATNHIYMNCATIQWCGMTVGIEPDGYTHT